jgi:putative FmdB family regulatory protein
VPLYEYQCGRCGRFEVIRKFSDEPLTVCPTCGQEIQKLLSAPAIQFKGTGWYITDYARKSSGGDKSKDGGAGKDASTSTESGAAKDGGASKDGGGGKDKGTSAPAAAAAGKSETSSTATKTAKSGSS